MSEGEELFALHLKAHGIFAHREYRFDPGRRWRFDFFIPQVNTGIEIEGGTWNSGRHSRGSGYEKDLEKYNAAQVAGYRVLRYTTAMVKDGRAIREVVEAMQ